MKHLHSYVSGTGQWLRESEAFREWEDGSERGCLCVRGSPGSGKSVFAASTVRTLAETKDRDERTAPVLFFFFRQIVEKNHDPKYLVRDWVAQLLPFSIGLRKEISALSKETGVGGIEMTKLWDALVGALEKVEKVYCVADAVDEMDDQHASFIEKLIELGLRQPKNIKILLTSRPIPQIESQLRDSGMEVLKLESIQIYPDIVSYMTSRLESLKPRLAGDKEEQVKDAICRRAEGLFLYARLMMDSLTEGLREGTIFEGTLSTLLEQLPMNLKELYTKILEEHSRLSRVSQEQQLTILQCVTQSSRPLRLVELGSIIALLRRDTGAGLNEGKNLVRQACGQLLEIQEDESVSVIHHSFTDFIRDKSRIGEKGALPVLDEKTAQRMMLEVCLKYLDACEIPEPEQISAVQNLDHRDSRIRADEKKHQEVQNLRNSYPFMAYATENIAYHIEKVDTGDSNVLDVFDTYFVPGKPAFKIWLLVEWPNYRRSKVQPLHIAAYLGFTRYAQHLINTRSVINARDGERRTALFYAAEKGHVEIASLLLANGADPDSNDRVGYKPLHLAAMKNQIEITKLLLAAGVHPKTRKTRCTDELRNERLGDDTGETPLQYACEQGYKEILTQFTHCLDKEDACRCLHWTLRSSKPDAVEAILKTRKTPVDAFIDGRTALVIAAHRMEPDIIKVLLRYGADPNLRVNGGQLFSYDSTNHKITFKSEWKNGPTPMHAFAGLQPYNVLFGDKARGDECLKFLVVAGGDINARMQGNYTPLHLAGKRRSLTFYSEWEENKTEEIVTELLLQHGADVNARCGSGETPLHKISPERPKLVDILVKHGADVNAKDNRGWTALLSVIDSFARGYNVDYNPKPELIEKAVGKLLEHGADAKVEDEKGNTVFHLMFASVHKFYRSQELWETLIKAGADLNKTNKFGKPPLLSLEKEHSHRPETESLLKFLAEKGLQLQGTDSKGQNAIFRLFDSRSVNLESVQRVINLGCSVTARDKNGATILHHYLRSQMSFPIFDFLVDAGADPTAVDNEGNTLLHKVALWHPNKFSAKFKMLIDLKVPTDTQNNAGMTPLHIASANRGESSSSGEREEEQEFLHLLLKGKLCPISDVNKLDNRGAAPIHYAASFSEFHVGRLLRAGADPALKTHEGLTPVHIAARGRQSNVIGILLSEYKKRGVLKNLIDADDSSGQTALHYACRSGRPESVRYLLTAGANHSARDDMGRTPLHALAEFPKENALWNFKRVGISKDFDAAGITIRDLNRPCSDQTLEARNSDSVRTRDVLQMLEKAGADLKATYVADGVAHTPMDVAVQTACAEMVNELRERGLAAQGLAAKALIPLLGGMKEARKLLERVKPPIWRGHRSSEDGQATKKQHAKKFKEILEQCDYSLFNKFLKAGADLTALGGVWDIGGVWLKSGLHELVKWGHADLLEVLVQQEAWIDDEEWMQEKENPGTLLCEACEYKLPRLDVIKVLVEKAKVNVNRVSDRYRCAYKGIKATALHWLATGSHFWNMEALEYLLDHGANIEAKNAHGETPLMVAVGSYPPNGFWKEETIRLLLERGANPNVLRSNRKTCLHMSDHANVTRMLLDYGADVKLGKCSPLTSAVKSMSVDITKVLLEAGANPNTENPLYTAARPSEECSDEHPVLRRQSQEEMISLLLKHGADPFAFCVDRSTVLQKVIEEHGILDLFWDLPDFPVDLRGKGDRTPLISACYPTTTPTPRDNSKPKTKPVSIPEAVLILIAKNASVDAKDNQRRTALHWLCTLPEELDEPNQAVFKALVELSPDLIHQRDNQGFKPLHLAAVNSHTHIWITDYLISRGCDPKEPGPAGNTVLHYLAPQLLGEKTKALAAAERFKYLLSLGVPIDHRNKLGETPLLRFMCTSWGGTKGGVGPSHTTSAIADDIAHVKALPIFLQAGADLLARNTEGQTLLHVTAKRWPKGKQFPGRGQQDDMLDIFKELLGRGLDPRVEDHKCRTAVDIAVANRHSFIVDLCGEKGKAELVRDVATEDKEGGEAKE